MCSGTLVVKGLSQIHRAPYDFRTRRLAVEFRDRASEFHFYGVHGHISNGARTMPGRYLKFEVARRPSTSRTGPNRVPTGCSLHSSGPRLTKKCPAAPFPCSVLLNTFYGVRIVYIFSETVLLKDLPTRVHSFTEKIYIKIGRKGRFRRNGSSRILRIL